MDEQLPCKKGGILALEKLMSHFANGTLNASVAIVGGGFCGSTTAQQQLLEKKFHAHNGISVSTRIFDLKKPGAGQFSEADSSLFQLNQPRNRMSPFEQLPYHYAEWAAATTGTGDENAFDSRFTYGRYLELSFQQTLRDHNNNGLSVKPVQTEIASVQFSHHDIRLVTKDGQQFDCNDALVIADGHQKSDFLSFLRDESGYFETPFSTDNVRRAVRTLESRQPTEERQSVAIVGLGPSGIENLAILHDSGFTGDVYMISRHEVEPWAFHPEDHPLHDNREPYKLRYLNPDQIEVLRDILDTTGLKAIFEKERQNAKQAGYGFGHVIGALQMQELRDVFTRAGKPEHVEYIKSLYGNPTSPERYKLYQEYRQSGRLHLVQANVSKDTIAKIPDGFKLDIGKGRHLTPSLLFNGASFSRNPKDSPIIAQAIAAGAIELGPGLTIKPGQQKDPRVFIVGPSTESLKWGVETFRPNIKLIASQSLEFAITH